MNIFLPTTSVLHLSLSVFGRSHRVERLLQPQADQGGQGVVQHQQHDGVDKVVPLEVRVHYESPRLGAVALHDGRDTKQAAEDGHVVRKDRFRL